ncbi:hypothetical protein QN277_023193 [Acacia crassicarpa]|uniref:Uncharacterized protein n=1 Tax=Acacia crassicarpa TaxID=499986 RepID=A0AAE1MLQ8_9FABA|nr:hypothetical protein QN277_023193 [Acacia crassicarpa]
MPSLKWRTCTLKQSFSNPSNKWRKSLIIDPGLYSLKKSEIWWVSKQRSLPTAFKLYTGNTVPSSESTLLLLQQELLLGHKALRLEDSPAAQHKHLEGRK